MSKASRDKKKTLGKTHEQLLKAQRFTLVLSRPDIEELIEAINCVANEWGTPRADEDELGRRLIVALLTPDPKTD